MIRDIIDDAKADDPCLSENKVTTVMVWLQDYIDWIEAAGSDGKTAILTVNPEVSIGDVSDLAWTSDAMIDRVEHTPGGIRVHIKPISTTEEYRNTY